MNEIYIPDRIKAYIEGKEYSLDDIGMSGSKILLFDDCVLKIEKQSENFDKMVEMMRWMEGKVPVPKVLEVVYEGEWAYLLMSRMEGEMSCSEKYLERPEELATILAEGMKMLWSVDISDCPRIRDVDAELCEAAYRVKHRLVDVDNVEPDTFGEGGFRDPEHLLQWLRDNRPTYEPVLSHGDYCLPNVFIKDGRVSGFIDLGDTGVGDKWRDIALCYRSFIHNRDGSFGGKVYEDFDPERLFEKLQVEPNREKLRWYRLLDELF